MALLYLQEKNSKNFDLERKLLNQNLNYLKNLQDPVQD